MQRTDIIRYCEEYRRCKVLTPQRKCQACRPSVEVFHEVTSVGGSQVDGSILAQCLSGRKALRKR
jgi:hypothetical protein